MDRKRFLPTPPQDIPLSTALFLDVDGTLLEIAERPEAVKLAPSLTKVLTTLNDHYRGALAFISGRTINNIDEIFSPLRLPVAGQHGLERRNAFGDRKTSDIGNALHGLHEPLRAFANKNRGILIEDKGAALALHFRLAPELHEKAQNLVQRLTSDNEALHYYAGKMVFEIKPRDVDKGNAIAAFMNEQPFLNKTPIFLGDDVTDEDGFRFVNQKGGMSILVGDEKETEARYRLSDVNSVHQWLRAITKNYGKPGR
ncbi:MAG: trehalose-phosphatase [Alphaproteobacteria bacterium]